MVAQMLGRVALFLHWLVTISLLPGVPGWWRYILLACLVAAEGPMATLLGAAAAASGVMQLPGVYLAAVIGNLTADTLWYLLGRGGKTRWLRWMEGRAGLSPEQSQYIQEHLQRRATRWIFVAKLTAGLMIPTLVAAGLLRIPWRKWFPEEIRAVLEHLAAQDRALEAIYTQLLALKSEQPPSRTRPDKSSS
ncbi:MAG: hypothetical protein KatS3mg050_2432 [Litorilinea sp.]|nr:MAG: hypothetical protein KatS3mg050_2432 [Litorilinea sp.]